MGADAYWGLVLEIALEMDHVCAHFGEIAGRWITVALAGVRRGFGGWRCPHSGMGCPGVDSGCGELRKIPHLRSEMWGTRACGSGKDF